MEKFLEALRGLLADGDGVALAAVGARSGSAPRDAGARMLVGRSGRLWGTVGGGLVEHEAELLAMETLRSGTSALREFCLRAEGLERIGMVCGGDVTLAVQYLPGGAADGRRTEMPPGRWRRLAGLPAVHCRGGRPLFSGERGGGDTVFGLEAAGGRRGSV